MAYLLISLAIMSIGLAANLYIATVVKSWPALLLVGFFVFVIFMNMLFMLFLIVLQILPAEIVADYLPF